MNVRANGVDQIIPKEAYIAHYVGEGPIGLADSGLRFRDGAIVPDLAGDIADGQGFDFADFPVIGTIVPTTRFDLRHAVTDASNWGMI